jgi:hydroxyacylglutathione hydrolase
MEPDNKAIEEKILVCKRLRERGDFTVGQRLGEERLVNPFIRCFSENKEYFSEITGEVDPVRVFAKLRKLKDTFK